MTHHKPKETCHLAYEDEHDALITKLSADEHSYIHEHLATLTLLVDFTSANSILEIGTGRGDSTLALANGLMMNGRGYIITIDIDDCKEAKTAINSSYLSDFVTFIKSDSLKAQITGKYDIIFIDGLHTYSRVSAEIARYIPMVAQGGLMVFHDTYNPAHPGVKKAVDEFMHMKWDKWEQHEYFNCNGLTILRRKDESWEV